MYRAVMMSKRWIVSYVGDTASQDGENLDEFMTTGEPVLYADSKENLELAIGTDYEVAYDPTGGLEE